MSKAFVIAAKEMQIMFKSPIAYIVLLATSSVFNVFFFLIVDYNKEATLRDIFTLMEFLFVFFIPVLTMKVFSEEKQSGTMEFLLTMPITRTAIVLGKYLGMILFYSIIILLTSVYYLILEYFSTPDLLAALSGYFGIWLEGCLFIAIGLLMSSLTKNQIISAVCSYGAIFFLYFCASVTKYFSGFTKELVDYMSVMNHSKNLFAGIVITSDLIYFVSGIVFCLVLTKMFTNTKIVGTL